MPFVKRHRDYYKYGTEPNASIVGSFAKIDKGVASGFSTSQYLNMLELFRPENNTWERVICLTTGSDVDTVQYIDSTNELSNDFAGMKYALSKGKLQIYAGNTVGSWNIFSNPTTTTTILPNTTYYIKCLFDGSQYKLQTSTTGEFNGEEITECTASNTSAIYQSSTTLDSIGVQSARYNDPFKGSIDLSQSYININGSRWWSGDSYTKVGSWIDEGVVSGFTSANCLTTSALLPSSITSSEYVFKITTGASVTSPENQIISAHQSPNTGNIGIRGSKFHLFTGSWNGGVTTVLPNTTYILKTVFDGSSWTLYSSTDNSDWTQEVTWNTTTSYAGTNLYIGRDYDTTGEYFTGAIDLNKSYIKINGKEWWHGTKAVLSTEADADYYTDRNKLYNFTRRQRKYYKDVYQDWTQPVLTANGELGGASFACFVGSNYSGNPAYYAFDGKDTTAWASNLTNTQDYIVFYNPKQLLVSEIVCTNKSWITGLWEVYGSNNNRDYELLASGENTDATDGSTFTIDLSSNKKPYKYYKIQCLTTLANQRVGMGEIKITAQELKAIIEVPSSSITDFGRTAYYKNIVTTKYWKEITTGSKELAYACYASGYVSYAKAPLGSDTTVYYVGNAKTYANSIDELIADTSGILVWGTITEEQAVYTAGGAYPRKADKDLYIDTTVTETVEGTPEDYTYTTEEVTTVEVSAGDNYDYTEFVPSTQYDYHVDNNKLYNVINPKNYKTLQISAVPNDAIITINNEERNSITAVKGSKITWSVKAEGYASQRGTVTLDEDTVLNITLNSSVYEDDQVVFESATAGTYEVEIAQDGNYEVYCIGGGGGGAFTSSSSGLGSNSNAGGGSGSGFIGTVKLLKNIYSVTVGAGGAWTKATGNKASRGNAGGDSSVGDSVIVYGGAGGYNSDSTHPYGGVGGAEPLINVESVEETLNTAGNTGAKSTSTGNTSNKNIAGGASVYEGYGKGGTSSSNGIAGYVKIVWKG